MFNELVVDAAAGRPVDKNALTNLVMQRVMTQSKNAGIDYETEGKRIAAEYLAEAENNPAGFQQYLKERMFADLDKATRAEKMTPKSLHKDCQNQACMLQPKALYANCPPQTKSRRVQPLANQAGQPQAASSQRDVIARQLTQPIQKPWVSIEFQA
jgi:hypothetical protein